MFILPSNNKSMTHTYFEILKTTREKNLERHMKTNHITIYFSFSNQLIFFSVKRNPDFRSTVSHIFSTVFHIPRWIENWKSKKGREVFLPHPLLHQHWNQRVGDKTHSERVDTKHITKHMWKNFSESLFPKNSKMFPRFFWWRTAFRLWPTQHLQFFLH